MQFLNQPYPDKSGFAAMMKEASISGFIVFAFLAFFQPFDLHTAGSNAPWLAFQFGVITFFACIIFESFFSYVVKINRDRPSWTFWKWLSMTLLLIVFIASVNYFYVFMTLSRDLNVAEFLVMLRSTLAVGIFPSFIIGSLNLNRRKKEYQEIAKTISPKETEISTSVNVSLPIKNSTKTFDLDASKILYLESMQNYVQIHYLNDNGLPQKEMHRNTIASLEEVLQSHGIKRTHRSFLVNTNMIKSVSGNAQGLKLELEYGDGVVPVSRKYIKEFR